jgi:hypothetical protein
MDVSSVQSPCVLMGRRGRPKWRLCSAGLISRHGRRASPRSFRSVVFPDQSISSLSSPTRRSGYWVRQTGSLIRSPHCRCGTMGEAQIGERRCCRMISSLLRGRAPPRSLGTATGSVYPSPCPDPGRQDGYQVSETRPVIVSQAPSLSVRNDRGGPNAGAVLVSSHRTTSSWRSFRGFVLIDKAVSV